MRRSETSDAARILLWLFIALVLAFTILGIVMSLAMGWTSFGMMGVGSGWMGLIMAIPAIVIVVIILVVLGAFDTTYSSRNLAVETLDLRLARGEITIEDYSRLKEELGK